MIKNEANNQPVQPQATTEKRPNDTGTISVEGFVKIFDPNTRETFVEKRA